MADFGAFTRICHSQICTFLSRERHCCKSWHSTTVLPFLVLLICFAVPTLSESVLCILGGFCNPNLISGFTLVIISICLLLLVWVYEGEGTGGGGTIVSSWLRQDGELLAFLFFYFFSFSLHSKGHGQYHQCQLWKYCYHYSTLEKTRLYQTHDLCPFWLVLTLYIQIVNTKMV